MSFFIIHYSLLSYLKELFPWGVWVIFSTPCKFVCVLCAVCLWQWVHRLEFSHWRCQLALGDGKRAWVGSAVTSCSSRTSLPPSHFVSRYFPSSSPLRICPFFYHPIPCSIPASPLLISSVNFFVLPTFSTPFSFLPLLLLCHFVWAPAVLL